MISRKSLAQFESINSVRIIIHSLLCCTIFCYCYCHFHNESTKHFTVCNLIAIFVCLTSLGREDSTLRILVATDNHLGYMEKDPLRGEDSFVTFEEILQIALKEQVNLMPIY